MTDPITADHWHELTTHGITMLPGQEPGTALRVRVESCPKGGCIHLEQMAYSPTLGWYRQKSFRLPGSQTGDLARLLRMAQCLLPQPVSPQADAPLKFPAFPHTPASADEPGQRSG